MMRVNLDLSRMRVAGSQFVKAVRDFFEPEGIAAFPGIVKQGLVILLAEVRWLIGPDIVFRRDIVRLQHQQIFYQSEIARMATLVDPRRDQVAMDLALLEEDLIRKQTLRASRRAR